MVTLTCEPAGVVGWSAGLRQGQVPGFMWGGVELVWVAYRGGMMLYTTGYTPQRERADEAEQGQQGQQGQQRSGGAPQS